MRFPMNVSINSIEAHILELSLRPTNLEDENEGLHKKRAWLLEIGNCLINDEFGKITLESMEDFWFLRDNIKPEISLGELTGMEFIKKLYGLLIGYKVDIVYPEKPTRRKRRANKNKTEDNAKVTNSA